MRVAVVGVGRWGINHARVLTSLKKEGVKIANEYIEKVLIVDKDYARAKTIARTFQADKALNNIEDLRAEKVDAAIVAVPTVFHYEVASRLVKETNVLVEKPLAATVEEGKKLVSLAEKEGHVLAVGHIERFNPAISLLKKELSERKDVPNFIQAGRVGPGPKPSSTLNLGVAHDLLVHDIDIAIFLVGDMPRKVKAVARYINSFPYEVDIAALFLFENNVLADLHSSWLSSSKLKDRNLRVQTNERAYNVDYITQTLQVIEGLVEHKHYSHFLDVYSRYRARKSTTISTLSGGVEPLRLELISYLESVVRNVEPVVSGLDGLKALMCVEKALESAKSDGFVLIPESSWL